MTKLLAIDMDGTCLDDHRRISAPTMDALRQASAAGITVVPTTGRALTCLPFQLQRETFYRYVISSNGACTTDRYSREVLYRALIPRQDVRGFLEACRKLHVGISAHAGHDFLLEGEMLSLIGKIGYGKDAKNTVCVKDLTGYLEQKQLDIEEIQLFYFSPRQREQLEAILAQQTGLAYAWDDQYVEIYSPAASKGSALRALADYLQIPKEQVACIGDAANDLPMFEASGIRFAMGNAIDGLKEQADQVLPSNNEDGVAAAVGLLLNR